MNHTVQRDPGSSSWQLVSWKGQQMVFSLKNSKLIEESTEWLWEALQCTARITWSSLAAGKKTHRPMSKRPTDTQGLSGVFWKWYSGSVTLHTVMSMISHWRLRAEWILIIKRPIIHALPSRVAARTQRWCFWQMADSCGRRSPADPRTVLASSSLNFYL